jgi:hypothetical protein
MASFADRLRGESTMPLPSDTDVPVTGEGSTDRLPAPPPAAPNPPSPHHRLRWLLVGLAVTVVLGVAALVGLFLLREDPGAKDVDQAIDEFRSTSATAGSGGPRPAAGVYRSSAEGDAELSFPPIDQVDGDVVPLTLEHLADGCWRITVDFNEWHSQSWDHCVVDGRILERGGQTVQRWDVGAATLDNTSTFTCDPPIVLVDPTATPGASWPQSCAGTNSAIAGTTTSAGPYTYVGPDELEIGGQPVEVHHYVQERAITGSQEGRNIVDYWFAEDGLPVRMERTVDVATDSPVGAITYRESGWWELTSLEPAS